MGNLSMRQVDAILQGIDFYDDPIQDREICKFSPKLLTKVEAIDLMTTAVDVHDWNQKREIVKNNVALEDLYDRRNFDGIMFSIDARGLCSQVAKLNSWPKRR